MPFGDAQPANSFMLWIDSVGGYWVCLADEVIIGQPGDRERVGDKAVADVPLLADISARHARIRRDGEGYVIDALREVRVAGRRAEQSMPLADGNQIELGAAVKMQFRRPHPLSMSARLEFVSHHRTQPASDGVLLLADSCVLGPKSHSHIVCGNWRREVILFRYEDSLFCHAAGYFEIDGVACKNRSRLQTNSQVRGEGFAFSLESI